MPATLLRQARLADEEGEGVHRGSPQHSEAGCILKHNQLHSIDLGVLEVGVCNLGQPTVALLQAREAAAAVPAHDSGWRPADGGTTCDQQKPVQCLSQVRPSPRTKEGPLLSHQGHQQLMVQAQCRNTR